MEYIFSKGQFFMVKLNCLLYFAGMYLAFETKKYLCIVLVL